MFPIRGVLPNTHIPNFTSHPSKRRRLHTRICNKKMDYNFPPTVSDWTKKISDDDIFVYEDGRLPRHKLDDKYSAITITKHTTNLTQNIIYRTGNICKADLPHVDSFDLSVSINIKSMATDFKDFVNKIIPSGTPHSNPFACICNSFQFFDVFTCLIENH